MKVLSRQEWRRESPIDMVSKELGQKMGTDYYSVDLKMLYLSIPSCLRSVRFMSQSLEKQA